MGECAFLVVYANSTTCLVFRDERDFSGVKPDSQGYHHARAFTTGIYQQFEYFRDNGIEITEIPEEVPADKLDAARAFYAIDGERIRAPTPKEVREARSVFRI